MSTSLLRAWHKVYSWGCESYLGIDTRGVVQPITSEGVHYTPLPYAMIFRMLDTLNLRPHDVFADIGCGKGRVVCCACRIPISKVIAIENNSLLLDQTIGNAERVRGRKTPVETVRGSADDYDYATTTVAYLYNPFNARLTERVIDRIHQSYMQNPRPIRVVYANPVHEDAVARHGWLEKYAEWPASEFPTFGYPVSFWRSLERPARDHGSP